MKNKLLSLFLIISVMIAGCKKDNKEAPESTITGSITFNKLPIGVRSGAVELELWQYGYQLRNKIPVYVKQDGTFSAKIFNGNYKLTMLKGSGPWVDRADSIDVSVNGSAIVDVTVDPFFVVNNPTFQKSGNTINASFGIQRINTSKALDQVRIYIGQTIITDNNNNNANSSKTAAQITDLNQPVTLSVNIPASLAGKESAFVRVGVKAVGVNEYAYSMPQEISLK